jgi:hypothetical protein
MRKRSFDFIFFRYVHIGALKSFLSVLDPSESLWVGQEYGKVREIFSAPGFIVGGAGYIFSWKAVDILVAKLNDVRSDEDIGCLRSYATSEEEPMLGKIAFTSK